MSFIEHLNKSNEFNTMGGSVSLQSLNAEGVELARKTLMRLIMSMK